MKQKISHITIVVDDYDKAIAFYTQKLNFFLIEDTYISPDKRWVKIAPNLSSDFSLLLAKASNEIQITRIGNQTGGRVFLFLYTTDFEKQYQNLLANNIKIVREPKTESYGKVLVFEDCYGNLWDLIATTEDNTEKFYTTGILKVIEKENIQKTIIALRELKKHTDNELGNITFEIQQSKEDATTFLIWECFVNQIEFYKHLNSQHTKKFLQLGLVEFVKGFETTKI